MNRPALYLGGLGGLIWVCAGNLQAASECDGRVPHYVVEGNARMVLTEEAEKVLCRDDTKLPIWDGKLIAGNARAVVEGKVVPSTLLVNTFSHEAEIEFRSCIFPDEVFFQGNVRPGMVFDGCEFRGNLDVHNSQLAGEMRLDRSVLHQGVHIADSNFMQPLRISGSVIAGDMQVDNSSFLGGIRLVGTRLLGDFVGNGIQSPVGLSFEEARFLGSLSVTGLEIGGGVRFRECEWDEKALISFTKGTIAGGLRFDGCGFESSWDSIKSSGVPLVRLADITVASSMVLADAKSKRFPTVRVSRCLIPFVKLPQWSIAKEMVLLRPNESPSERDLEDSGELLQLVRKSYEAQGRTRDAVETKNAHRLMMARIKGQPVLGLRLALSRFGTGLWWFLGTIVTFAGFLWLFGKRWRLVAPNGRFGIYSALDLSLRSFLKGPPENVDKDLATRMSPLARKILVLERVLGWIFLFLLGLAVKEWLEG